MADQKISGGAVRRFLQLVFTILLPGFWLATAFAGPFAPRNVVAAVFIAALGAALAASAVKHGYFRGPGMAIVALLGYSLLAGGRFAPLAAGVFIGALLSGEGGMRHRGWFGAAFAAGVGAGALGLIGAGAEMILYPLVLAVFLCRGVRKIRWYSCIFLILLMPPASMFLAWNRCVPPVDMSRAGTSVPPALPASLLPRDGARRILFLSNLMSRLPGVWCALPYVDEVIAVWPGGTLIRGDSWSKMHVLAGPPGRMAREAGEEFDLIFVEALPPAGEPARREFFSALSSQLKPNAGVLVVPVEYAREVPDLGDRLLLPGGEGKFIAVGKKLDRRAELLDAKLQALQKECAGEAVVMPPGIFSALYDDAAEPEADKLVAPSPSPPESGTQSGTRSAMGTIFSLRGKFVLLAVVWLVCRLILLRKGCGYHAAATAESFGALTLVVLAAAADLEMRELTGGVMPNAALGLFGLSVIPFVLRSLRGERILIAAGALLPFAVPGAWLTAAAIPAAFATAETGERCRRETQLPEAVFILRAAVGVIAGAVLFRFLNDDPLAALTFALLLRLIRVVR